MLEEKYYLKNHYMSDVVRYVGFQKAQNHEHDTICPHSLGHVVYFHLTSSFASLQCGKKVTHNTILCKMSDISFKANLLKDHKPILINAITVVFSNTIVNHELK